MSSQPRTEQKPSALQMVGSVLAAAFGVQSSRNRERDFRKGSPARFVVLGIIGTLVFVLTVVTVVRLVLRAAGV